MAIHSSVLAWRIPWQEEPDGLPSTGSHGVGHDLAAAAAAAAAGALRPNVPKTLISNFTVPVLPQISSCDLSTVWPNKSKL